MKLSKRAMQLEPSVTLAAAAKAKQLKSEGYDVLSLTVGEPDFPTPENIREAAVTAIRSGEASFYTQAAGIPELRRAVVDYMKTYYGLDYGIEETIVTDGAKFALYALFQAILDKGDEVIIPVPYWVSYAEQVKLAEGVPVFVEGLQEADFKVTVPQLEAARTEKTVAVLLNSPSNPTGMIYTKDELRAIGEWAVEHGLLIIADDIYGRLVYNGNTFTPMATVSREIRKNTIVINGVSKTYAMTGWRIGFAIGNKEIIAAMAKITSQSTSNPTAASQYAALEALTGEQDSVELMRQAFEERLNKLYPLVAAIPGVKLTKPQGAFYLFPNMAGTMELCGYDNVTTFVNDLLEDALVATVTGAGFGAPENLRISYAADWDTLEEAVRRITAFVEKKRLK
ncbi:aspartate aminotransferase [Enterococcus asini ATCC 700915]|uniref:Aminotransferase n=1 Tax=Enterococcus asini ATCC 700915 TaxID=1158606 RepID=R2RU88_9ENTE|nr:pyridoxal phosphate-dependent aminotransferase [Enterococcus asini]EOH86875.1 aspartate aminotransferase [Enterococcus asini ATCC 700915]EOT58202.1 aspartate aminotransferase [Enterococcus asini ATCC 700915]MCD5028405.1 pyridoxal phosphate-dependent aminotransferase [Enterococcus asini]MDT2762724.1 pyridoxal phosphate-dependent aminotransferase [Enterococcus asini]OJG13161.1 aspartate aminotransferase [Enterococcus asini]